LNAHQSGAGSTVVVGVDGSESSRRALEWALDEARLRNATLRLVHAWRMPYAPAATGYAPLPLAPLYDAAEAGARHVLEAEAAAIEPGGVVIDHLLVEGGPASALIQAARSAGLVVVGSRGRGGFAGLALGSVGQQVAHHAPCPVVVVR
jgi:nucleotide-binding universal stress UspA family protein